jgi:hypothetical protein
MTVEELKQNEEKIQEEILKLCKEYDPKKEPICDGIVSEELYLSSKYKIMWMLKEPYGDGGYKLGTDLLIPKRRHEVINYWIPAMHLMTYVTFGLLYNKHYEEMDSIKNNPEMSEVLTRIAWVNINKTPGKTKSGDMIKEYNFWKNLLFTQIKTYSPDILIFGGTFQHFKNDWENNFSSLPELKRKNFTKYFIKNNMIVISTYHPAYPEAYHKVDSKDYINDIIDIVNYGK